MPTKEILLSGVGRVKIYKRKGAKSVRLSIVGDGSVRVTQPRWLPYRIGEEFAAKRRHWIMQHRRPQNRLRHEQKIGKTYTLLFLADKTAKKPASRIVGHSIHIRIPFGLHESDEVAQETALRAVERALKHDAEELLIPRLKQKAAEHGFSYRSVSIKRLKSRWGSCSREKDIVLNSYLVQLPWELIDYVILHELQHTTILAHGEPFWSALDAHVNDLKRLRKSIKRFQAKVI